MNIEHQLARRKFTKKYYKQGGLYIYQDPYTVGEWLIDSTTGIALGKDQNCFSYRTHHEKSDDSYTWEIKYFCEPESCLYMYNEEMRYYTYLNYLNWKSFISTNTESTAGHIYIRRLSESGFNYKFSDPQAVISTCVDPQIDIFITQIMHKGSYVIEEKITLVNTSSHKFTFLYCYQDGAYLWAKMLNQKDVKFIHFPLDSSENLSTTSGYSQIQEVPYFCGLYHTKKNILGGCFSSSKDSLVGCLPFYVGKSVPPGPQMFAYFNQVYDYTSLIECLNTIGDREPLKNYHIKNRFVCVPFSEVLPGQKVSQSFYRVHLQDINNEEILTEHEWKSQILGVLHQENYI